MILISDNFSTFFLLIFINLNSYFIKNIWFDFIKFIFLLNLN